MISVLPVKVTLDLVRDGAAATMTYTEHFQGCANPVTGAVMTDDDVRALVVRTMAVFSGASGAWGGNLAVKSSDDGMGVIVTGSGPYTRLATFVASEFFCWSEVAEMKLRDLIISSVAR